MSKEKGRKERENEKNESKRETARGGAGEGESGERERLRPREGERPRHPLALSGSTVSVVCWQSHCLCLIDTAECSEVIVLEVHSLVLPSEIAGFPMLRTK